jgi:hypothetical protein
VEICPPWGSKVKNPDRIESYVHISSTLEDPHAAELEEEKKKEEEEEEDGDDEDGLCMRDISASIISHLP